MVSTALQWLSASSGILALVGVIISWPKTRGEGRQAEGAGQLSLTEAQVKAQENALKSAESAASRAEAACSKCELARERIEANFKRFIGFVDDELVALLPEPEIRARARAAIREAWQTL